MAGNTLLANAEDAKTDCSYCRSPCCQLLVELTEKETETFEWQEATFQNRTSKVLKRREDGYCVYYVHGKGCSTYDVRPRVCVLYSCRTDARIGAQLKYGPIVPVPNP